MANNKFDIKVFTDELNKAFTILKKEQVLEKYMKNVLLNYNSIIYIGNITDEPNTYNTIYNYMYGEDNTLCNIVIFETDGFVDSTTNIIPSGIHIAYPYLDYSVCIDYKYILNINNSAELLTPTQEYKTINNESILGSGNISVQEPLVSGTNIKTINNQSILESGNVPVQEPLVSGNNIKTVNEQSLLGTGNIAVQEKLVSGTNIKTINNQSILGAGNMDISGSNFQIIDVTSSGRANSISSVYNLVIDSEAPTFSNQSAIFNNIATAVNNGLVPILKFVDGYGYYKEYLSSSSEYVFTLNHITNQEGATNPANNVITLKVGNTSNEGYYNNLSQIPYTVIIKSGAFGDSGSLTSTESRNLRELLTTAQYNLSAGIFILNSVDKKIYYVSNVWTSSFEIIAYTVNKYGVEVLAFAKSGQQEDILVYTKTTYSLSGSSGNMVNLGTLSNSGTLEAEILQELLNLFGNLQIIQALFIYNNNIYITANAYSNGSSMGIVAYDVSNSLNAVNLSINTTNASYTITTVSLPTSFKTINGSNITGDGNIVVQEPLVSGTNIKTINGQTMLGSGDLKTGLPAKQYTISNLDFINFSEGQSVSISASDSAIIENARTNNASVIYNEVNLQYLPLLYVEIANDVQVLYNDLHGHCGVVSINTTTNTATVLSVFKTGKNSTINLDTISSTKTNYDNVFNYLFEQGFARAYFNVEGFLDPANSIGNEQYYEAYLSEENKYFASCGKIYQYIVDTSSQGFHVELVGNSLFRSISKNTLRMLSSSVLGISPNSTLTNVSILLGANVSKGQRKYTFDNPRMNFQFNSNFGNSFAFTNSKLNIKESIYTKLFTWSYESNTVVPTVSSTKVSTWYPTNWHKGTATSQNITATILDFSNLPSGTTYNEFFNGFHEFPKAIYYKFNNNMNRYQEYRTFRFSLRFVFDYQGVSINSGDQLYYDRKWTGTLQNNYLEVIARLDFTNKQVVIYQRIRKFA